MTEQTHVVGSRAEAAALIVSRHERLELWARPRNRDRWLPLQRTVQRSAAAGEITRCEARAPGWLYCAVEPGTDPNAQDGGAPCRTSPAS